MMQTWRDLLFAHWPVPAKLLQPHMPPAFQAETHSGSAWIAVVPFRMTGIRLRGLPAMPMISETLELNVRTYTTVGGVPGVYFFSLDAASKLAVRIARRFFYLPYFDAAMSCQADGGQFKYRSHRLNTGLQCSVDYAPTGPVTTAVVGSLEHFLTERYCLYTIGGKGEALRGRVKHLPWPLQPARANFAVNSMTELLGLELTGNPLLHFSRELQVSIEGLERC